VGGDPDISTYERGKWLRARGGLSGLKEGQGKKSGQAKHYQKKELKIGTRNLPEKGKYAAKDKEYALSITKLFFSQASVLSKF